jgi:hypothetical protein
LRVTNRGCAALVAVVLAGAAVWIGLWLFFGR